MRKLRALPLALLAALAITAIASASAQASDHLRCGAPNPGTETCEIRVTQDPNKPAQTFTTALGSVVCQEFHAHYKGPATLNSDSTLTGVEYKGNCEFAGVEAEVNFGTCDYKLTSPIDTIEEHGQGNVILGPEGCKVTIVVGAPAEPICELTVPGGQTFTNAITYTETETSGIEEVTGHASTKEIEYVVSGECVGGGEIPLEGGSYEGTFTAKAFNTAGTQQTNLTTAVT